MLLRRLSCPANDVPLACGVSRVIDSSRPEIVGSVAMSSRPTDVAAPVLVDAKTGSLTPVTSICSAIVMASTLTSTSLTTPRLIERFSTVFGANATPLPPTYNTWTV